MSDKLTKEQKKEVVSFFFHGCINISNGWIDNDEIGDDGPHEVIAAAFVSALENFMDEPLHITIEGEADG
jgi:hypothetical protein